MVVSLFSQNEEIVDSIDLMKKYENCQKCSLCKNRQKVVFWDGPAKSPVFVLGEAPGANEDQKGVPFSGKAGIRLNELFSKLLIDRKKLHISNICLCRPVENGKNGKPSIEQARMCYSRLKAEIRICSPKVIVCLGGYATAAILGKYEKPVGFPAVVGMYRGWHDDILVSWHPAYELRKRQMGDSSITKDMYFDWKEVLSRVPEIGLGYGE